MGLRGPQPNIERRQRIVNLFSDGKTMEEVGSEFGISRERVRQILAKAGMDAADGGFAERRRRRLRAKLDAQRLRWGMTSAEKDRISKEWMAMGCLDPRLTYTQHKTNASRRGIAFEMTFSEWMAVWGEQYGERGRAGLTMCRYGDQGPYRVGNVYIATQSQNMKDYWSRCTG